MIDEFEWSADPDRLFRGWLAWLLRWHSRGEIATFTGIPGYYLRRYEDGMSPQARHAWSLFQMDEDTPCSQVYKSRQRPKPPFHGDEMRQAVQWAHGERGKTYQWMGERAGCCRECVFRWANGETSEPLWRNAGRLVLVLRDVFRFETH